MNKEFTCALVTGATSGIGEAVARLLADKKIPLIISGRQKERLDQIAAELRKSVPVEAFVADLEIPNERERLLNVIREKAPDLVINNAGISYYGDVIQHSNQQSVDIVRVNVEAALDVAIEAGRALVDAKRQGVILNVSSVASQIVCPGMAVYGASKAFLTTFSEAFDWELRSFGVRVLASCPGIVETRFRERSGGKYYEGEKAVIMSAEFAAEQIWWQIVKRRSVYIFDWKYRLITFLTRHFIPQSLVAKIMKNSMDARTKK